MECAGEEHGGNNPTAPPLLAESDTGSRQSENQDTCTMFSAFEQCYDTAFAMAQRGLRAEEEGDTAAAVQHYACSLSLLEDVLATDCEAWAAGSATQTETAQQMKSKANKTKLQITYRLESLQARETSSPPDASLGSQAEEGVRLPSYEEAMASPPSSPVSGADGEDAMRMPPDTCLPAGGLPAVSGTELFHIADGVKIFHITCEGVVSAPSYPTSLRVIKIDDLPEDDDGSECEVQGAARAFLQVGDWLYPLIPGASPILHTTFGAYLFPDLSAEGTGSSVGLILPETLSQDEHRTLEDVLCNFSVVQEQQAPTREEGRSSPSAPLSEPEEASAPRTGSGTENREEEAPSCGIADQSTSAKISHGILVASSWISWGLGKGAEKAGQWISYGSAKLRDRLQPAATPRPVDPRVQKGVMYARKATNAAVSVSAFIVTKLGEATVALGRQVAPHIRKGGEKIVPQSVKTEQNKSRLQGVVQVAASGLQGFSTVWLSLESAAKSLGRSIARETVSTVHHKYGAEASRLAENTVFAAGNVAMTAYTAESLAARAIVKRTAKDAGAAVVDDLQETVGRGQAGGQTDGAVGNQGEGQDKAGMESKSAM